MAKARMTAFTECLPVANSRMGEEIRRVVRAAELIRLDPLPGDSDMAFMARDLVQVTLPHSNPGNMPVWGRTNGNVTLTIKPDWKIDPVTGETHCVGLPYGTIPRLLLFWITTEALRKKERRLVLGDSLSSFMRQLDLMPTGGAQGTITRLKNQMERLFRAKISFEQKLSNGDAYGEQWVDMPVAPRGELWWSHKLPNQGSLFGSWIELGEEFFDAVTHLPVPVDLRALRALKKSPLALDLYAWATYRTFRVNQAGQEAFIPWRGMMKQFGGDYSDVSGFKRRAKDALSKVQAVFPGLDMLDVHGGIVIRPGRTAVALRKSVPRGD